MISAAPWKIGSTKNELPSCCRPAMPTASTSTAMMVPQALTRPGRTVVAPSSAPTKAGSRNSGPTELCATCSRAARMHAGEADDQPAADEGAHDQAARRTPVSSAARRLEPMA